MNAELIEFLDHEGCYLRADCTAVTHGLLRLRVSPTASFVDFYEKYEGPFHSDFTGFTLNDIVAGGEASIFGATEALGRKFSLPHQYLAISDPVGDGILIYDCCPDLVFGVDFEEVLARLREGILRPERTSFDEFIHEYFLGDSGT